MDSNQIKRLEEYHRYLERNYASGVDRFFSPTGFLEKFERHIEITAHLRREAVYVSNIDEAVTKLVPVVAGGEGVYDLVAEPGTGKTTVLPFKFPSSRVVVALPTPFDAWSAFNTASGPAMLHLKGLKLGSMKQNKVCYMDSYLAANMIMSGFLDYDILIVDECDSGKGVTGFLADVKAKDKVLIRMSATHGRSSAGPSTGFTVTEDDTMPDIRKGVEKLARFVTTNARGRSLVMTPDAEAAVALGRLLPNAVVVSSKSTLADIGKATVDQSGDCLFVSDEVCGRGLNLNLNMVFDCQLVTEFGTMRHVTDKEAYQRKGRVGRNKAGFYFSPALRYSESRVSDADVMRSNVVRAVAGLAQHGELRAQVSPFEAEELMMAAVEPYEIMAAAARRRVRRGSKSRSSSRHSRKSSKSSRRSSYEIVDPMPQLEELVIEDDKEEVPIPSWLMWAAGSVGKVEGVKTTYVRTTKGTEGRKSFHRSSSSGSDTSLTSLQAAGYPKPGAASSGTALPLAIGAPYAHGGQLAVRPAMEVVRAPKAPPIMDLAGLGYQMDWPALLGDLIERCVDLPTIIPPHSWRHTAVSGLGSNWVVRLEHLATVDLGFTAPEMEVVCRAWNLIVAGTWVKKSPGLSAYAQRDSLEFCLRYFQSYHNVHTAS